MYMIYFLPPHLMTNNQTPKTIYERMTHIDYVPWYKMLRVKLIGKKIVVIDEWYELTYYIVWNHQYVADYKKLP